MTNARDVALKTLLRVAHGGAFAAPVLSAELAALSDPRDAALASELVLGVLRRGPWLERLLGQFLDAKNKKKLEPTVRLVLELGAYQLAFLDRVPPHAAVSEAVAQAKRHKAERAAGLVNAVLRRIASLPLAARRPPQTDDGADYAELGVRLGVPTWLALRLAAERGRSWLLAFGHAINGPSRRTLRINTDKISREEALKRLGPNAEAGALSPCAVHVDASDTAAALVDEGLALIQDEGAQLVALALDPQAKELVLDACAGRGGKTSALAMLSAGQAELVAVDRAGNKLERLAFDLARQGYHATTVIANLEQPSAGVMGPFDKILVDAPCSGTGTLGRRPDIRARLTEASIAELALVQARLLENAARRLKPGGRLVFATCSVLEAEGRCHLEALLARHPELAPACPSALWPAAVSFEGGFAFLDPVTTGADGYQLLAVERTR